MVTRPDRERDGMRAGRGRTVGRRASAVGSTSIYLSYSYLVSTARPMTSVCTTDLPAPVE